MLWLVELFHELETDASGCGDERDSAAPERALDHGGAPHAVEVPDLHGKIRHPGDRHARSVPILRHRAPVPSARGEQTLATTDAVTRHDRGTPRLDTAGAALRSLLRRRRRAGGLAVAPRGVG